MFRTPFPSQLAQFRALFEHILDDPPTNELLPAFVALLRYQSYQRYRYNLSQEITFCKDLVANVGDREFLWYGPWDTTADFWFRSIGLHVIPQYPLWRLRDGGSHKKLDDAGKKSVTNWRATVLAEVQFTPSADQPHFLPILSDSSVSGDVSEFEDDHFFDLSIDEVPPVEPSEEHLEDMRLAGRANLELARNENALDTSHLTAQTFDVSHPVIVRERGDNSLVADFAVLTLQGGNMSDVFDADNAPPPDAYRSPQEENDMTMSEELTKFLENLRRGTQGNQPSSSRGLGNHLGLARVLLLLEAKRHATAARDIDAALVKSVRQVVQQARYCFDMPNVTRLVAVASSGDIWKWAVLHKSKTEKTRDKNGGEIADVERDIAWSKELVLGSEESEDHWVTVVKVVRELMEEAETEAAL